MAELLPPPRLEHVSGLEASKLLATLPKIKVFASFVAGTNTTPVPKGSYQLSETDGTVKFSTETSDGGDIDFVLSGKKEKIAVSTKNTRSRDGKWHKSYQVSPIGSDRAKWVGFTEDQE